MFSNEVKFLILLFVCLNLLFYIYCKCMYIENFSNYTDLYFDSVNEFDLNVDLSNIKPYNYTPKEIKKKTNTEIEKLFAEHTVTNSKQNKASEKNNNIYNLETDMEGIENESRTSNKLNHITTVDTIHMIERDGYQDRISYN